MAIENESDSPPANEPPGQFQPYIPASKVIPEFTWPAVVVGAHLAIIFGSSCLYLLLKVGMTVSASVPIAVLSITLFRVFSKSFGFRRATILENNIVQTTGSAGESIAFGVGVTMPALLLLGFELDITRVMTVSVLGGELAPEMLGVGYLIGPRIASLMIAGAVLSYFVLGPLLATFGDKLDVPVSPAVSKIDEKTGKDMGLIRNMGPGELKSTYLRYIGAGAVAAGGIISMCRALPLIFASILAGLRDLRASRS